MVLVVVVAGADMRYTSDDNAWGTRFSVTCHDQILLLLPPPPLYLLIYHILPPSRARVSRFILLAVFGLLRVLLYDSYLSIIRAPSPHSYVYISIVYRSVYTKFIRTAPIFLPPPIDIVHYNGVALLSGRRHVITYSHAHTSIHLYTWMYKQT